MADQATCLTAGAHNMGGVRPVVRVNTARLSTVYYAEAALGPPAVRTALSALRWADAGAKVECDVYWWDTPINRQHFAALRPGQAINRFYGMVLYGRACAIAPRTWLARQAL
ncbi:hypothetical protein T492DRAFT_882604 [Pavlovales sp. CCMP2436]|nr:hypothetical protein T492DRAFT_882604 [Pavlovales sp. CCMP2436]